MTNVLVYGLGAIGGCYAYFFSQNANVTVVARSNAQVVKTKGLTIKSDFYGEHVVKFKDVWTTPQEGDFDYVVCTNKALDPEGLPKTLAKSITPGKTSIVIIQNGAGAEEPFVKNFPNNTVISCVTWTGATQVETGVIKHFTADNLSVGLYHGDEAKVNDFVGLLKGFNYQIFDNILLVRWEKLVWNCACNSVTGLTFLNTKDWFDSSREAEVITRQLMKEVITAGRADGVPLEFELEETLMKRVNSFPKGLTSSMMTDLQAGRECEVEVILGHPMRVAQKHNISTPVLTTLYTLVKANNYRLTTVKKRESL